MFTDLSMSVVSGVILAANAVLFLLARLGKVDPSSHSWKVWRSKMPIVLYAIGLGLVVTLFLYPGSQDAHQLSQGTQGFLVTSLAVSLVLQLLSRSYPTVTH